VNQFPCGIAEPEEGMALFGLEVVAASVDLHTGKWRARLRWFRTVKSGERFGGHCGDAGSKKRASIHEQNSPVAVSQGRLVDQGRVLQVTLRTLRFEETRTIRDSPAAEEQWDFLAAAVAASAVASAAVAATGAAASPP